MKYIFTLLLAFTVLAGSAQTKSVKPMPAVRDTAYTVRLTVPQVQQLFGLLEAYYSSLPRSPDLTGLQASERQKQVFAISKMIQDQLSKQPIPDTTKTKK